MKATNDLSVTSQLGHKLVNLISLNCGCVAPTKSWTRLSIHTVSVAASPTDDAAAASAATAAVDSVAVHCISS